MGVLATIKSWWKAIVVGLSFIFLGWVYFLKKDNENLKVDIENKEKELKVQEEVHKEDLKVQRFNSKQEVYEEQVEEVDRVLEKAKEEVKNEKVVGIPDDSVKLSI